MNRTFCLIAAFLAGFVALSYEILWYRIFSFASGGAAPAFAYLLGTYLLGLAAGAAFSGRLCARLPQAAERHRAFLADYLLLANVFGFLLIPVVARLLTVYGNWTTWIALVCPAAALLGAAYPLLNHLAVPAEDRVGPWVSYVYVSNILGSTAGSLGTGFWLLDRWTLPEAATAVAVVGVATTLIPAFSLRGTARRFRLATTLVAATLVVATARPLFHHTWERLRLQGHYAAGVADFPHVVENRAGVVAVASDGNVYGGGLYDGAFSISLQHDSNSIIRAFVGLALHPAPRDVLLIGASTGSWAQVVAHHTAVERLACVEINPGYLDLYPRFATSRSLLSNPKVTMHVDDGRRWLVRNAEPRYDLIIVNVYNWTSHATNLLSVEALELMRRHLKPGGLLYYNTTSAPRIQRTGASLFPHALRVMNWLAVSDAPFTYRRDDLLRLLETYRFEGQPLVDDEALRSRWLAVRLERLEKDMETRDALLARTAGLSVVTDDNMGTEWTGYPLRAP